jgi:outer membrane immunogenic protein
MAKFVFALAACVLVAGSASAADLAPHPYTKAPIQPPAPVANWSGFYIGGDAGWAGQHQDATATALPAGFGPPAIDGASLAGFGILPMPYSLNRNGFIGGVYAGYNWQIGATVVGIEADASYLDGSRSGIDNLTPTFTGASAFAPYGTFSVTENSHWLASLRGRLGYTWGNVLLYGTGGVAFSEEKFDSTLTITNPLVGAPGGTVSSSETKVGYAVGAGVEWMATANWLLRAEYLHYGFGGASDSLPVVGGLTCTAAVNCHFAVTASNSNIDTVRIGLAYKFGAPLVAKY